MIKNLIFDFGKVLVDYEYFETLDQIFKTHEQAEEFYHLLIDGKWNENMDRGDSFEDTFCKMQQIMPQYKNEIAVVAQRFNEFVRGEKEGMRDLLAQLKSEDFHLYGLSNWCTKCHETMAQYPIFQLLEGQVISSEERSSSQTWQFTSAFARSILYCQKNAFCRRQNGKCRSSPKIRNAGHLL